ncbi:MAG TPA: glutamate 5-kinase [Geminicoccaceae bacterium]|nr:glutamate 5-kinase [Geminicoccaceae bacterium]
MQPAALLARRRVTIKIGSALLVDGEGRIRRAWLDGLAADIGELARRGSRVIVVTSGAIALGRRALGLPQRALRLEEKQAAAAAGQILLAGAWAESLAGHGLIAAQLLVTLGDTEGRRRYLNARATIETLLKLGAVPVVNENDTVATAEIRYGDNDRLSARVAVMSGAETLVLLSDVDGLYTADPGRDPAARHIPEVGAITAEIEAMATGSGSAVGTGGMASKLVAATIATQSGCAVLLTSGKPDRPLEALRSGARCTVFAARSTPRRARKHWLAATLKPAGRLTVDDGALAALRRGSSLLPAGVAAVEGRFERGDAVLVQNLQGTVVAKGLVAYDAADAERLRGRRTADIEALLGYRGRDEMIHRDDLVLVQAPGEPAGEAAVGTEAP